MNSLDGLSIFIQVAERRSFSATADKFNTSKANISRQISRLESRLGVQLFHRTTRKVNLTEAGQAFYLNIYGKLQELDEVQRAIQDLQAIPRGTLRITTAGLFGETTVAVAAACYMQRYSEVNIELDFSDRIVDLIGEGYNLAIRSGTLEDSSLVARRISSHRLMLCASPRYIQEYGLPNTPADLKEHFCLQGSAPTWHLKEENGNNVNHKFDGRWKSNNGHAILQTCINGLGIAQLPEYYVSEAIGRGQLIPMLEKYEPSDMGIWAVYPSNRNLPSKVRLFIDLLLEREEISCTRGAF